MPTAVDRAFSHLDPLMSAQSGLTPSQIVALAGLAAAVAIGSLAATAASSTVLAVLGTAGFAALLAVRLYTLWCLVSPLPGDQPTAASPAVGPSGAGPLNLELPRYTVLVTLYDEAAVVPSLVRSLDALDYPRDRLDVLFLTETDDVTTRQALENCHLKPHLQVVVVPAGSPRTKPRALCYGLAQSRGDYVVVFDAEDRPEPDQLLKAAAAFASSGRDLGCLQARLNVYNPRQSVTTVQFAVEYTALFDGTLPALIRAGAAVPLGGTSNHFPRAVLDATGGWDPWNVTEDADLGLRLARAGYRVEMLASTTWEEAPSTFAVWLRQRTRWQKGWLQTYLVHMRDPVRLLRDLGLWRFMWFQAVFGGGLLAALSHPWFVAGLLMVAATPSSPSGTAATGEFATAIWWVGVVNLAAAAATTIAIGLVTAGRRGFAGFAGPALVSPALWLPVSVAAYCAIVDLLRRPFHWAKTPHGQSMVAEPIASAEPARAST